MASVGEGGFEVRSGQNAESAGVASGEMALDLLLVGGREFSVDVGVELVGAEMVRIEMFDCRVGLRCLVHRDSPRCG
jgi:hypothetical protein